LALGFCAFIEGSTRDLSGFNDECLLAFCESRAKLFEPLVEPEGLGPSLVDELSEASSSSGFFDCLGALLSSVAPPLAGLFVAGRLKVLVKVTASRGIAVSRVEAGWSPSLGVATRRCFADVFGRCVFSSSRLRFFIDDL
jgi:hypothetical protein